MKILILILPLSNSIIAGFLGRFIGANGVWRVTLLTLSSTLILVLHSFYSYLHSGITTWVPLHTWLYFSNLYIELGLLIDSVSIVMLLLISIITFCVHVFAFGYMQIDAHLCRFISYLSLFTFFMLLLVSANNCVQLFIGWEGVGLCSYLLIAFWFTRTQANIGALKAVIINRFGDLALILAVGLLFMSYKTLQYDIIFSLHNKIEDTNYNNYICILLLIAAIGKSAQIGLHTWLADAMEGPTPVSALLHSATMVTAGIFIIIRFSKLFEPFSTVTIIMGFIGLGTIGISSIAALYYDDIKKIIAYSTCSQLGYMLYACSLAQYTISLFHLFNHGFFKALLFLCSGALIHASKNEQDLRALICTPSIMPITSICFSIGAAALMSFPFTAGFYSKETLLLIGLQQESVSIQLLFYASIFCASLTQLYNIHIFYSLLYQSFLVTKFRLTTYTEQGNIILIPIILLTILSICSGYLFEDLFIGLGSPFWESSIISNTMSLLEVEENAIAITLWSWIGYFILTEYSEELKKISTNILLSRVEAFFKTNGAIDIIYNKASTSLFLMFGYQACLKLLDKGLFEVIFSLNLSSRILTIITKILHIQRGYLYEYFFWIVLVFFYISLLSLKYI